MDADDFVDIDETARFAKTSISTIRRRLRDPDSSFPRPVVFSSHVHLWLRHELVLSDHLARGVVTGIAFWEALGKRAVFAGKICRARLPV